MQIENYIVDILRNEMGLDQQHIWIQNQNRKIPPESDNLYCIVGCVNMRPISSKSRFRTINGEEVEVQEVYGRADVQIDLLSRSNEARERRAEVLMALNSFYSKNLQDGVHFRIFELPSSFINTSDLQGGSDINRFTIRIPTMVTESKVKSADYYDSFQANISIEEANVDNFDLNLSEE